MPYLLPLARGNKLIFIDERGSGRSEKLEDATQYTVENMVEDVESVRQALHLGKISLMGHSYGGVLAQAYAFKYQQNLTHLVLGGTFYSTREMNKVLAEEKRSMPPEALAKLEALEKAGLFNLKFERFTGMKSTIQGLGIILNGYIRGKLRPTEGLQVIFCNRRTRNRSDLWISTM